MPNIVPLTWHKNLQWLGRWYQIQESVFDMIIQVDNTENTKSQCETSSDQQGPINENNGGRQV